MHFWIHIEFTKILGQFKPKKIVDLFMRCYFKFFLIVIFILKIIITCLNTLLNKLKDHIFIYNNWINFAKENVC
jgi:hypothetical protein